MMSDRRFRDKIGQLTDALRKRSGRNQVMTLDSLKEICRENGLPTCPAAVTRLELNCQLFTEIGECISAYWAVSCLHLERNNITRIAHLQPLRQLVCLYLQNNQIAVIEGLDGLPIKVLDLSSNQIKLIQGLDGLPALQTLLLSDNMLTDVASISHLSACGGLLAELDIGRNRIEDVRALDVLASLPLLQTLTLIYNPLAAQADPSSARGDTPPILPHYRRTCISLCQGLTALDHKAVFPQERAYAEAWWRTRCSDNADSKGLRSRVSDSGPQHPSCRAAALDSNEEGAQLAFLPGEMASFALTGGSHSHGQEHDSQDQSHTRSLFRSGSDSALPGSSGSVVAAHPPADLLFPVLAKLEVRPTLMAALVCRDWALAAAEHLQARRLEAAKATMARPELSHAALSCLLLSVPPAQQLRDALLPIESPARPVAHLFYALSLLWHKLPPPSPPACASGHCPDERTSAQGSALTDSTASGSHEADDKGAAGGSGTEQHQPGSLSTTVQQDERDASAQADTGSKLEWSAVTEACTGTSHPDGVAEADEEAVDMDRSTWRQTVWQEARQMLQDPRFPVALPQALPLTWHELRRLRCRSGTANDLEHYVPELDAADVARHAPVVRSLCEWLLAVERRALAEYELQSAEAWTWPKRWAAARQQQQQSTQEDSVASGAYVAQID